MKLINKLALPLVFSFGLLSTNICEAAKPESYDLQVALMKYVVAYQAYVKAKYSSDPAERNSAASLGKFYKTCYAKYQQMLREEDLYHPEDKREKNDPAGNYNNKATKPQTWHTIHTQKIEEVADKVLNIVSDIVGAPDGGDLTGDKTVGDLTTETEVEVKTSTGVNEEEIASMADKNADSIADDAASSAATEAAGDASEKAAGDAAEQAAGDAASEAAEDAAESAAESAAEEAAERAAEEAAANAAEEAAARAAEEAAASAAEEAAASAAEEAATEVVEQTVNEVIEEEYKETVAEAEKAESTEGQADEDGSALESLANGLKDGVDGVLGKVGETLGVSSNSEDNGGGSSETTE